MFNEKFWLAIAFTVFAALIIKFTKSKLNKSLDDKSKMIAEEILAAKEMKERAAKLLVSTEKYNQESLNYSQKLIRDAELEAQRFLAEAQKSVEEEVAKKTAAALVRIEQEQMEAVRKIKNQIIASALQTVENSTTSLDEKQSSAILLRATQDLEKVI
jgi:F-type H+-transporting ATPase subunit b